MSMTKSEVLRNFMQNAPNGQGECAPCNVYSLHAVSRSCTKIPWSLCHNAMNCMRMGVRPAKATFSSGTHPATDSGGSDRIGHGEVASGVWPLGDGRKGRQKIALDHRATSRLYQTRKYKPYPLPIVRIADSVASAAGLFNGSSRFRKMLTLA
jgi:hypothetical protein